MVVVGKDISPELGPLELLVEMLWCHFTRQGWYESGARILGIDTAGVAVARAG
jgi:hypothetical protein